MTEDAAASQARLLLATLSAQVADCTTRLSVVEGRLQRRTYCASTDRRQRHDLRRELTEMQRLIANLHDRFPHLAAPA